MVDCLLHDRVSLNRDHALSFYFVAQFVRKPVPTFRIVL